MLRSCTQDYNHASELSELLSDCDEVSCILHPQNAGDQRHMKQLHRFIVVVLVDISVTRLPTMARFRPPLSSYSTNPAPQTNSVDLPAATQDAIRKFRFKRFKGDAALVVKIDKKSLTMVVDEQLEGSLEEIAEGTCPFGSV